VTVRKINDFPSDSKKKMFKINIPATSTKRQLISHNESHLSSSVRTLQWSERRDCHRLLRNNPKNELQSKAGFLPLWLLGLGNVAKTTGVSSLLCKQTRSKLMERKWLRIIIFQGRSLLVHTKQRYFFDQFIGRWGSDVMTHDVGVLTKKKKASRSKNDNQQMIEQLGGRKPENHRTKREPRVDKHESPPIPSSDGMSTNAWRCVASSSFTNTDRARLTRTLSFALDLAARSSKF
jgi:hypothetical protein